MRHYLGRWPKVDNRMCIITSEIRCKRSSADELLRINENPNRVIYIFEKETHLIVCPIAGKLDWNSLYITYWARRERVTSVRWWNQILRHAIFSLLLRRMSVTRISRSTIRETKHRSCNDYHYRTIDFYPYKLSKSPAKETNHKTNMFVSLKKSHGFNTRSYSGLVCARARLRCGYNVPFMRSNHLLVSLKFQLTCVRAHM